MFNITNLPDSADLLQTSADGTSTATYKLADMVWVLAGTAFVWPMIPAIGFLYSGLSPRKSAAGMVFQCFASICVISFQWFFWGYSLAYSGDAGGRGFIGDLKRFAMMDIESATPQAYYIPEVLYCFFQMTFAAATVAIATGGATGRARMLPMLIWQFWWVTLVYCPLAHWVWSASGWVYQLGTLDYAGGTPVHVASGSAALAYTLYLSEIWKPVSKRPAKMMPSEPWNPMHVLFATMVLWGGWIAFDGAGGNVAINVRSVMAASTTNLSGASGAIAWTVVDFVRTGRLSIVSACSGAIAGLVGITPACGYVGHPAAVLIGALNGVVCNYATKIKTLLHFEDPADVVGVHLVGGIIGNMMTGLFAQAEIAGIDGVTEIPGGAFIDGHWRQIGLQLADTVAAIAWSFTVSFVLLAIIDRIPGCKVRASDEAVLVGTDLECLMENFLGHQPDLPSAAGSADMHIVEQRFRSDSSIQEKEEQPSAPATRPATSAA